MFKVFLYCAFNDYGICNDDINVAFHISLGAIIRHYCFTYGLCSFSFWHCHCVYLKSFVVVPPFLNFLLFFSPPQTFSLCLLVWGDSIGISVYSVSFLNCVWFIHKPIKDILRFFAVFLTSRIYFLFFFKNFHLYLRYLFFFICFEFWLWWVFVAVCGLYLVVVSGCCLLWSSGFSFQWLLLLQSVGCRVCRLQ